MKGNIFRVILSTALLVAAGIHLSGCGGTTTSGGLTGISDLPKATGAIGTSSSSGAVILRTKNDILAAATTGVTLAAIDTGGYWGAGESAAFCEVSRTVRDTVYSAGRPDKILCYVGVMEQAGLFTDSYDGNNHYYHLTGAGDGDLKIKFNATKDETGKINSFHMWECDDGSTQSGYISQSISAGSVSMTAVDYHTGTGYVGQQRSTVSGTIDAGGAWLTKTLTTLGHHESGSYENSQSVTIDQLVDRLNVQMANYGTDGSGLPFSGRVYAIIQGLNMNRISSFALGDGTAQAAFTFNGVPIFTASGSTGEFQSWNGDTRAPLGTASNGDYYTSVQAESLPTALSAHYTTEVDFSGSEIWNCAAATTFTDVDFGPIEDDATFSAAFNACNTRFGGDDHGYVDCHNGDH